MNATTEQAETAKSEFGPKNRLNTYETNAWMLLFRGRGDVM